MDPLRQYLRGYRLIDDQIRELNGKLNEKRDVRKMVEHKITKILSDPQFSQIKKLKLEDDGSTFRVQHPNTYQKPWTLSQKDLKGLLEGYFMNNTNPNAEECHKYICEKRKSELVATEFAITRVLLNENEIM